MSDLFDDDNDGDASWVRASEIDAARVERRAKMLEMDGNQLQFKIQKNKQGDGKTFSKEAVGALFEEISDFVMARMIRYWDDTGQPPQGMTITVGIKING